LETSSGPDFLGIKVELTTTKWVLINQEGKVLFTFNDSNRGNPVALAARVLKLLYLVLYFQLKTPHSCSIGYEE
jgi:activator of 2-hydroxyglutaryl-CoA dehydratase